MEEMTYEDHLASKHMFLSDQLQYATSEQEAAELRLAIETLESEMQHLRAE